MTSHSTPPGRLLIQDGERGCSTPRDPKKRPERHPGVKESRTGRNRARAAPLSWHHVRVASIPADPRVDIRPVPRPGYSRSRHASAFCGRSCARVPDAGLRCGLSSAAGSVSVGGRCSTGGVSQVLWHLLGPACGGHGIHGLPGPHATAPVGARSPVRVGPSHGAGLGWGPSGSVYKLARQPDCDRPGVWTGGGIFLCGRARGWLWEGPPE